MSLKTTRMWTEMIVSEHQLSHDKCRAAFSNQRRKILSQIEMSFQHLPSLSNQREVSLKLLLQQMQCTVKLDQWISKTDPLSLTRKLQIIGPS